jgi:hypothetical protein
MVEEAKGGELQGVRPNKNAVTRKGASALQRVEGSNGKPVKPGEGKLSVLFIVGPPRLHAPG